MSDSSYLKNVYMLDSHSGEIALTRRVLASAGFPVCLQVVPSAAALKHLLSDSSEFRSADLILIDIARPDEECFILLNWIRQQALSVMTPIVMVAAEASDEDVVRGYEAGISSYILKSRDFTEYALQLKEVCSHWLELQLTPEYRLSKSA